MDLSCLSKVLLIGLLISSVCSSCNRSTGIEKEVLIDFLKHHVDKDEYNKLREEFDNFILNAFEYSHSGVRPLKMSEWELIEPILINSKLKRSVCFIGVRGNDGAFKNSSVKAFWGYKHLGKWNFHRSIGTQFLQTLRVDEGVLLTFDQISEYVYANMMNNYLVRDRDSDGLAINDAYFKNYAYNPDMLSMDERKSIGEIDTLSNAFWIEKYSVLTDRRERKIRIIDSVRSVEDGLRSRGKISDDEWGLIQRIRDPQTSDDWRLLDSFYNQILLHE